MKTVISTPFPVPKKTAAEFGVTDERLRWLASLMDAIGEGRDVHAFAGRRVYKATKTKKKGNGIQRRTRKV